MTVRGILPCEANKAKALWTEVFSDPREFTDWYFQNRIDWTCAFGAFDGDDLISMSLGRIVRLWNGTFDVKALFLVGVSTKIAYRNQGWMHRVVRMQLETASENGIPLAYLRPARSDIYRSLGFGNDLMVQKVSVQYRQKDFVCRRYTEPPIEELFELYCKIQNRYSGMPVYTPMEFADIVTEYSISKADCFVLYDPDGSAQGFCFAEDADADVTASLLLADTEEAYRDLLNGVCARYPAKTVLAEVPTDIRLEGQEIPSFQYKLLQAELDFSPMHCIGNW